MTGGSLDAVRAVFEAFNRNDREAMKRLVAPNIEIVPLRAALEGIAYRGADAVDRFWEASHESWSEILLELEQIEQGRSAVFVLGRIRARGRETGAPVDAEVGLVVGFEEEKIVRMATYTDIEEARRVAGVES